MKQTEIKFEYHIDSSLDLEEVLESVYEQLKFETGKLTYYEGEAHEEITKTLSFKELKEQTIEAYNDEKWPSIDLENASIIIGEDDIQISSKVKLDLKEFDAEEEII